MGKVKAKKILKKEEKKNPFDLRFNKVKHKIINEKQKKCVYGSNPYESRNKANELRKKTLLVEYKNRNKTGTIKFVDKQNQKTGNRQDRGDNRSIDKDESRSRQTKKKDNAEYMSEMFEKKRRSQIEKEKIEDLKVKLDDQFNQIKNSFLSREMARKELSNSKKIDNYDLILNDLLINRSERYVPNLPLSK